MIMKLGLVFPEFRVTGQYKITGKIFALPIEGIGPFWAIISERQINMLSLKKKRNFIFLVLCDFR